MFQPSTASELAGLFTGGMLIVAVYGALLLFVVYPLLALLAVINLGGIRHELRDIAEQLSLPSRHP